MADQTTTMQARLSNRLGILTNRNFALLWYGQILATFGDKFTDIAIPILIYRLTGSPLQLGLAFIAQVASALLFGLVAGALCDRWDRRRTMLISDLIRFGLVMVIPLMLLIELPVGTKLGILYALIFLIASVKQFFVPAKVAAIPELVPKDRLMAANSLDQSAMKLMEFAGYGAAGLLIQVAGTSPAFLVNSATYLISAIFIFLIRMPSRVSVEAEKRHKLLEEIQDGLAYIRQMPILLGTAIISLIAPLALGATMPLLIMYVDQVMRAGPPGFALMEAVFGLGLSIGVLLVGKYAKDANRWSILSYGVIGMSLGMLLTFGLPLLILDRSPLAMLAVALPFFFITAGANGAIFLGIRIIVQENVPGQMIGRVFAVITVASSIAAALGASLAGIADIIPVGLLFLLWSSFLLVVGIIAASFRPSQISVEAI
jgi:MFS family permease